MSYTPYPLSPEQLALSVITPATFLHKWRAKFGAVKSSMGNSNQTKVQLKVLCVGDSITEGAYSNSSASGDWNTSAWPKQLANLFKNIGINANCNGRMGFLDVANDPRITFSNGYTIVPTGTDSTIGGAYAFSNGGSSTGTGIAILPTENVDTFKIWSPATTGADTLNFNINGGANSTLNLNVSASLISGSITGTLGSNTLNISKATANANNIFLTGWEAWNSAQSNINIINAGWDGATTTNWVGNAHPWSPANIATLGADLTIISLGINDLLLSNNIPSSTTKTNIQTLITSALTTGDVLLVCENPAPVASTISLANQKVYWDAVKLLADTNNIPVVSIFDRWVSYEFSSTLGYYQSTAFPANLHPVGLGYADYAQAIFNVLARA